MALSIKQTAIMMLILFIFFAYFMSGIIMEMFRLQGPPTLLSSIPLIMMVGPIVLALAILIHAIFFRKTPFVNLNQTKKFVDMEKKRVYLVMALIFIPALGFIFYMFGGFSLGKLVAMVVAVLVFMVVGYGLRRMSNLNIGFIIFFAILSPLIMFFLINAIGFNFLYDSADMSECFAPIRTDSMRESCIERHIGDVGDASICDLVEQIQEERGIYGTGQVDDNHVTKEECYYELAIVKKDVSFCYLIPENTTNCYGDMCTLVRNDCLTNLARNTLNYEICKDVIDYVDESNTTHHVRDSCLSEIARRTDS